MQVQIGGSTDNFVDVSLEAIALELEDSPDRERIMQDMQKFSQNYARICYTAKDFSELLFEAPNKKLLRGLINSGHHSVFEHMNFTLNFSGVPKALAMVLNNEKQYATSEKSARYTQMADVEPHQKELYDKWIGILTPKIESVYPTMENQKARNLAIKKLAQENARYMTSVFTPTMMGHTINWRQLNFLANRFDGFIKGSEQRNCSDEYAERLIPSMQEFNKQVSGLRVEGMDNQTDRYLSLFHPVAEEDHFGASVYSTGYLMSFAGLAQAHRHRTINYNLLDRIDIGAKLEFFVPRLIRRTNLADEWNEDLSSVAEYDFPQAQLLHVAERGMIEDFRSKTFLRMCGHAQHEIMENTLATAREYQAFQEQYGEKSLEPKCMQGQKCAGPCNWGGRNALTRLV